LSLTIPPYLAATMIAVEVGILGYLLGFAAKRILRRFTAQEVEGQ